MIIEPTKRSEVAWRDWEGPHSSDTTLTVYWLDEDNRDFAYTFRGLHAFWMAQVFKARDAKIKELTTERDAARRALAEARAENAQLRDALLAASPSEDGTGAKGRG